MASLSITCLMAAAAAYHVSVPALQAIRTVEGGRERQEVCRNFDGSCDLGPFQVNDRAWLGTLSERLRADRQVVRATLRDDGCWNAQVASWIMRQMLDQSGGDLPTAIGNYHSHWAPAHFAYRQKIASVLQSLQPGVLPPALPGGQGSGGLRIPPDVSAGSAAGQSEQKGKLIHIGPGAQASHATDAPPPDQDSNDLSGPPQPDPTPPPAARSAAPASHLKIFRGGSGGE